MSEGDAAPPRALTPAVLDAAQALTASGRREFYAAEVQAAVIAATGRGVRGERIRHALTRLAASGHLRERWERDGERRRERGPLRHYFRLAGTDEDEGSDEPVQVAGGFCVDGNCQPIERTAGD